MVYLFLCFIKYFPSITFYLTGGKTFQPTFVHATCSLVSTHTTSQECNPCVRESPGQKVGSYKLNPAWKKHLQQRNMERVSIPWVIKVYTTKINKSNCTREMCNIQTTQCKKVQWTGCTMRLSACRHSGGQPHVLPSKQFYTCGNQMVNLFRVGTIHNQTKPADFINRCYEIPQ